MEKLRELVTHLGELLPAFLFVLGLSSLVLAAWVFNLIAGLALLGVALLFTGWLLSDNTAKGGK